MISFQQHYVDLTTVLPLYVGDVAASCYSKSLIQADTNQTIISFPDMPPKRKVEQLLLAVEKSIKDDSTDDHQSLLQFVEVLKGQGSSVELIGDRIESTYRK